MYSIILPSMNPLSPGTDVTEIDPVSVIYPEMKEKEVIIYEDGRRFDFRLSEIIKVPD